MKSRKKYSTLLNTVEVSNLGDRKGLKSLKFDVDTPAETLHF